LSDRHGLREGPLENYGGIQRQDPCLGRP